MDVDMKIKHNSSGVVLLEVLISMVLFSFGVLGMIGLQVIATQNSVNSQDRAVASILANDMVSLMWIKKSDSITAAAIATDIAVWKTKVSQSVLANPLGDVTQAGNVITVTVTWKAPTKTSSDNRNKYETNVVIQ
jgi:type IV pilus assembly protein PilV